MADHRLQRSFQRQRWVWMIALGLLVFSLPALLTERQGGVWATFFDVGQGDGLLIRGLDNFDIVIDGGPTDRFGRQLAAELPARDRTIELMVLTHPHADHYFGQLSVFERYRVERVFVSGAASETQSYRRWQERLAAEGSTVTVASSGQAITFPGGRLTVLWPTGGALKRTRSLNDSSIVLRLEVGSECLILPGDVSAVVEAQLPPESLRCRVLKVGHHGSAASSSKAFLAAVQPEIAVISAGRNNRYGHPAPSTLRRLAEAARQVYRTDRDGTIRLTFPVAGNLNTSNDDVVVSVEKTKPF